MDLEVADQRILVGVPATLSFQYVDGSGEAAAPPAAVTVGVTKADGTIVVAAGTSTSGSSTFPRTLALAAANNLTLELLTATWTVGVGGPAFTTTIDVAGGFYFSIAEARASEPVALAIAKFSDAAIIAARQEVEDECEIITDVAWVPRYRRVTVDGSGSPDLSLPSNQLRRVRSVRVYSSATAYTTFTVSELADLTVSTDLRIRRPKGFYFDDTRNANVVVELEHGYNRPTPDLKRAALTRLRFKLANPKSGIPDRAREMTADGKTYRLAQPGLFKTGLPEVDAIYERHSRRADSDPDTGPASRSVNFDPTRFQVFHGGIR